MHTKLTDAVELFDIHINIDEQTVNFVVKTRIISKIQISQLISLI